MAAGQGVPRGSQALAQHRRRLVRRQRGEPLGAHIPPLWRRQDEGGRQAGTYEQIRAHGLPGSRLRGAPGQPVGGRAGCGPVRGGGVLDASPGGLRRGHEGCPEGGGSLPQGSHGGGGASGKEGLGRSPQGGAGLLQRRHPDRCRPREIDGGRGAPLGGARVPRGMQEPHDGVGMPIQTGRGPGVRGRLQKGARPEGAGGRPAVLGILRGQKPGQEGRSAPSRRVGIRGPCSS